MIGNSFWQLRFTVREVVGLLILSVTINGMSLTVPGAVLIFWGLIDRKLKDKNTE